MRRHSSRTVKDGQMRHEVLGADGLKQSQIKLGCFGLQYEPQHHPCEVVIVSLKLPRQRTWLEALWKVTCRTLESPCPRMALRTVRLQDPYQFDLACWLFRS
jgi:hypothetical protein